MKVCKSCSPSAFKRRFSKRVSFSLRGAAELSASRSESGRRSVRRSGRKPAGVFPARNNRRAAPRRRTIARSIEFIYTSDAPESFYLLKISRGAVSPLYRITLTVSITASRWRCSCDSSCWLARAFSKSTATSPPLVTPIRRPREKEE